MSKRIKVIGFIALTIAMFMGMLDSTIVNIALPDITKYFRETMADTSWISTVYVMGLAVFTITFSKLADIFGRKKFMILGLVLFGGSSALCGLTSSLTQLIMARLVQSIGGAIILPLVMPMGMEIFGKEKLRPVGGAVGAVTALAAAGGPPIGGLIIKYLSWQYIFFVNVPFAVVSLILIIAFIGESYDTTIPKKIDWLGMLLMTSALFLLTFALLKGNDYGWESTLILCMFGGALLSLVLFIAAELKIKSPMVDFSLFKEKTFTASILCSLIAGFGISSPILVFSYFLQNARGYEPLSAALIIMAVALTVIVSMPLGTYIAAKIGAKPVNFLGLLIMGIGVYMLSTLKMDTSEPTMIAYMVISGFGLGFASQSFISAVKYLPVEKSGVGTGIVNAARQVGICIGIALLVSILTGSVKTATSDFKASAVSAINGSSIAEPVKTAMIGDINSINGNDYTAGSESSDSQNKLETDIKNAVSSLTAAGSPSDANLSKLYDGAKSLDDGAQKILDGQNKLDTGIVSFRDGLNKLSSGSSELKNQLEKLQAGLTQAQGGAQAISAGGRDGLAALEAGVSRLQDGARRLQSQLTSSGDPENPSLYDGVAGITDGAGKLSAGVSSYVTSVDGTLFLMIKNDPSAPQLLAGYQASLQKSMSDYAKATDASVKKQLSLQIQSLQNLVNLYTAGTDASVTTAQQFTDKLVKLAGQSTNGASVVSGGSSLAAAAAQFSDASNKLSALFSDAGAFKSGIAQLVAGLETLKKNSESLGALTGGADSLSASLAQLTDGASQLVSGAEKLSSGVSDAVTHGGDLESASSQLIQADTDLSGGASEIMNGVGLAGQQKEIESVVNTIKSNRDEKIAGAFDSTFLLAAVILAVTSVAGLFTDRKLRLTADSTAK